MTWTDLYSLALILITGVCVSDDERATTHTSPSSTYVDEVSHIPIGSRLPVDLALANRKHFARNDRGLVAVARELPNTDRPHGKMTIVSLYADSDGFVVGKQLYVASGARGEDTAFAVFSFEFRVPESARRPPERPREQCLRMGEILAVGGTLDDAGHFDGPLEEKVKECSPLMQRWKLEHGQAFLPPHTTAAIRAPQSIREYAYYFLGWQPRAELLPPNNWSSARYALLGGGDPFITPVVLCMSFGFYDLSDLSVDGYDRSLKFSFPDRPCSVRIMNLGEDVYRISIVVGSSEARLRDLQTLSITLDTTQLTQQPAGSPARARASAGPPLGASRIVEDRISAEPILDQLQVGSGVPASIPDRIHMARNDRCLVVVGYRAHGGTTLAVRKTATFVSFHADGRIVAIKSVTFDELDRDYEPLQATVEFEVPEYAHRAPEPPRKQCLELGRMLANGDPPPVDAFDDGRCPVNQEWVQDCYAEGSERRRALGSLARTLSSEDDRITSARATKDGPHDIREYAIFVVAWPPDDELLPPDAGLTRAAWHKGEVMSRGHLANALYLHDLSDMTADGFNQEILVPPYTFRITHVGGRLYRITASGGDE